MRLPDKLYDVLKWLCSLFIPALVSLYVACAAIWGWPYAAEIAKTAAAVCTFIGALIGVSSVQYYKDK